MNEKADSVRAEFATNVGNRLRIPWQLGNLGLGTA